ncbi:MAG: hypothetical protein RL367_750 [Pseudomonadota bacterium]
MASSFTLGNHFESFIKRELNTGRYASASEVVRDGLRLLEDQEALRHGRLDALRADIEHGASSGPGIPADQAFANARRRIGEIAALAPES